MTTTSHKPTRPQAPTAEEAGQAREAAARLRRLGAAGPVTVRFTSEAGKREAVALPGPALGLLLDVLDRLAAGHAAAVIGADEELSTQQAAEALQVSRPFLVKLLDAGQVPHRKVGAHRRVLLRDVLAYKRKVDEQRLRALEELAAQGQELDMGY